MSDPENFLSRWSRLKHEAEQKVESPEADPVQATDAVESAEDAQPQTTAQPEFDPSTLPPIESIGAGTDIRSFLQKGVPAELTRAALRRAWTSDPAIRDFIEVAENQWDFATGRDLPGFGHLEMSDEVRSMVAELFQGRRPAPAEKPSSDLAASDPPQIPANEREIAPKKPEAVSSVEPEASALDESSPALVQRSDDTASQQDDAQSGTPQLAPARHGSALPQ